MVRTQILLEEEQYQFLKTRSRETGNSISALIRDVVERLRQNEPSLKQQAIRRLGAFEADRARMVAATLAPTLRDRAWNE